MKALKIAIVMLVLITSLGAVCAADSLSDDALSYDNPDIMEITDEDIQSSANPQNTFSDLEKDINVSGGSLEINYNYTFDNETDRTTGMLIAKDNFIINGNNHVLDGACQSRIFNITGTNITIANLVFANGNASKGGAIFITGEVTLNNVTFISNNVTDYGGAIYGENSTVTCNNARFIDNIAMAGPAIYFEDKSKVNVSNTTLTSKASCKYGQIVVRDSELRLDNLTFANIIGNYSPAVYATDSNNTIINSRFENLTATISAGAIAIKGNGETYIKNCTFVNTTSSKNAGAINADVDDITNLNNVTIAGCVFMNTTSSFGGAFIQLGGSLNLYDTNFTNSRASFNGGAVYLSQINAMISNCIFSSTGTETYEGYQTCGGAIYCDAAGLEISHSRFINNTASLGDAIYVYHSNYKITNTTFAENEMDICTFYDGDYVLLEDNNYSSNDSLSLNNEEYTTIIEGQAKELVLLNNTINVTTLPSRFDLRDWGWVSPVRNQGWIGSCWTFGMTGALESALLKAYGIKTDFSENNMRNSMLRYSIYGMSNLYEGGNNPASTGYLLSWLGAFPQDDDTYDEVGKISPVITTDEDIHIQDVVFIPNNEVPNGTQLKLALIKYGSLDVSYYGQSKFDEKNPWFNNNTNAQYCNESLGANHEVSLVGWDDNYPKENFVITPPGDGAWIIKNSWGDKWGDEGYLYLSYYDKTFIISNYLINYATAIIIENTVPYNKNYQYEFAWRGDYDDSGDDGSENYIFANRFEALDDDLIAAVGTYFIEEGYNYTVQIYVNDVLVYVQDGISPYYGYHTIKLDKYIPIKKGDVFMAAVSARFAPYIDFADIRGEVVENTSFLYSDGVWIDYVQEYNSIINLKAYTVEDDTKIINNTNITVDYAGESYFSVKVVTDDGREVCAGEVVTFTINNVTYNITTDENSTAKLEIKESPGEYTIVTKYNGKLYQNTVTVNNVLTATKATIKKKTAKNLVLAAKLKINGKNVKGKWIKFKLNGKKYYAKTNKYGTAKIILGKDAINNLNKGIYKVKVFFANSMIKTKVKVK